MMKTKVTLAGGENYSLRTTIPKPVREVLKIEKGAILCWSLQEGRVIISKE